MPKAEIVKNSHHTSSFSLTIMHFDKYAWYWYSFDTCEVLPVSTSIGLNNKEPLRVQKKITKNKYLPHWMFWGDINERIIYMPMLNIFSERNWFKMLINCSNLLMFANRSNIKKKKKKTIKTSHNVVNRNLNIPSLN